MSKKPQMRIEIKHRYDLLPFDMYESTRLTSNEKQRKIETFFLTSCLLYHLSIASRLNFHHKTLKKNQTKIESLIFKHTTFEK